MSKLEGQDSGNEPEHSTSAENADMQSTILSLHELLSGANDLQTMAIRACAAENVKNPLVIRALSTVPRSEFLTRGKQFAHFDMALPIGKKQTLTPPSAVAFMTDRLNVKSTDRVLEIGTGSGYQAAVLGKLAKDVYSVELHQELAERALETLKRLQISNVHVLVGDGFAGWAEKGPFDKIIVTCSPGTVPPALVDQLKEGGMIIIPVGERYQQMMEVGTKVDGEIVFEKLRTVFAVPMIGEADTHRNVESDPSGPRLVNGSFEKILHLEGRDVPEGWNVRHAEVVPNPGGNPTHFMRFKNSEPGKPSQIMQPFALDGSKTRLINFSFAISGADVSGGKAFAEIGFFTEDHDLKNMKGETKSEPIGVLEGDNEWQEACASLAVPPGTAYAILNIGLHGNTGQLEIANLDVKAIETAE